MTYPFGNQRWNEKTQRKMQRWYFDEFEQIKDIFDQHCLSFLEKREQQFTDSRNPQHLGHSANSLVIDYATLGLFFLGTSLSQSATLAIIVVDLKRFYDFFPLEFLRRFLVAFWWLFTIARKRGNWHQPQKEARKLTSTPNIVDSCILYLLYITNRNMKHYYTKLM